MQEGLLVEGNEGRDTFRLDLDVSLDPEWVEFAGGGTSGIVIQDFNSAEDRLVVELDDFTNEVYTPFEAFLTEQSRNEYQLELRVVGDNIAAVTPPRSINRTIQTTGPITRDDIFITR